MKKPGDEIILDMWKNGELEKEQAFSIIKMGNGAIEYFLKMCGFKKAAE